MPKLAWSKLPEQLSVQVWNGRPLDRPDEGELDTTLNDFENRTGVRLPISYREFMHWFGPGALSVWFQICCPIPPRYQGKVTAVFNIDEQREMLNDPDGYWASSVPLEDRKNLMLFASTEGGDWFFWNMSDRRGKTGHEYAVYGWSHDSNRLELIASTFKAFVLEVGLGSQYPFGGEEREVGLTYSPAWPAKK